MQLAGTYIAFRTGGSATEAMRIDGSGNVGIGTASPSANGKLTLSSASSSNYQTIIAGSVTSLVGTDSNGLALSALGANNVICYTLGTERMRIDSSGNLLVGTTTTQNAHINTVVDTTYDGIAITGNTSSSINAMAFRNTNGLIGRINLSGTATSFVTSSDYRLKENVAPMQNALNVVQQLKPVTYDWISTKEKGQGFIAHELQAVVPECVVGEKDAVDAEGKPVYQGIDTSFLVATLTAAIQEQQALITTLQTQVAAIQAKVGA